MQGDWTNCWILNTAIPLCLQLGHETERTQMSFCAFYSSRLSLFAIGQKKKRKEKTHTYETSIKKEIWGCFPYSIWYREIWSISSKRKSNLPRMHRARQPDLQLEKINTRVWPASLGSARTKVLGIPLGAGPGCVSKSTKPIVLSVEITEQHLWRKIIVLSLKTFCSSSGLETNNSAMYSP